jgi:hypothetical protein
MKSTHPYTFVVLLGLASTFGCEQKPVPGVRVLGSISVENKLLDEGLITFVPITGTAGKKCSVVIQEGKYAVDASQGLSAGEYRVEVMGLPPGIKDMAEGKSPSHSSSSYREIDQSFSERSNLKCTLRENVENIVNFSVKYAP